GDSARDRRHLCALPQPAGAARPRGLGALGRRAADAGDRSRPHGGAQADDARRALARPEPAPVGGSLQSHRCARPRARHHHPARRAEHASRLVAGQPRLRVRARTGGERGGARRASRRSHPARRLPRPRQRKAETGGAMTVGNHGPQRKDSVMIWKTAPALLVATWLAATTGVACAQEILLGYLPSSGGPFATFSKTNLVAAQMAVDQINAAGGVNGKKIRIVS